MHDSTGSTSIFLYLVLTLDYLTLGWKDAMTKKATAYSRCFKAKLWECGVA